MKTILKNLLNGKRLINNKKLLLAATFVSTAINCDAAKQELNNTHRTEDQRFLYQAKNVVTVDEDDKSQNLIILAEIIERGWQYKGIPNFPCVYCHHARNNVDKNAAFISTWLASWYFQTQQPIQISDIKEAIKIYLPKLDREERDKVFGKIMYYFFDKSMDGASCLKKINMTKTSKALQYNFMNPKTVNEDDKPDIFLRNLVSNHLRDREDFISHKFTNNRREKTAITINNDDITTIKVAQNNNLENLYLFKVLKYLEIEKDFINFIFINKKCHYAVASLKSNHISIRAERARLLFPALEILRLWEPEDKPIDRFNYQRMYDISYDEYVNLDRNNDYCINTRPASDYLKCGYIICSLKQYEQEKAHLTTLEGTERYDYVKNAIKLFKVSIDWNEWKHLSKEEQDKLMNEKGKSIRDVIVNYTTISHHGKTQHVNLQVPDGVTRIALTNIPEQKDLISKIILPESLNYVSADCFSQLDCLRSITFKTIGVVFEGHRTLSCWSPSFKKVYIEGNISKEDRELFKQKLGAAGFPSRFL